MDVKNEHLYFSKYRVSTITCNANIGKDINIDLHVLFKHIELKNQDNSFVWIQYLKEDDNNFRGDYPKKKRKSKKNTTNKNRFDNQITVIYRYTNDYMPNIKIFKNGNIQLTGIKDFEHPKMIVEKIIDNILNIYNNIDKEIIISNYIDTNPINRLAYENFKIRMINSDFKIYTDEQMTERFSIKRKELHNILISEKYNNKSSFQPGVYQGVKLEYYWNDNMTQKNNGVCKCLKNCFGKNTGYGDGNCKKVTIAIFESGSILITGGITLEQIEEAYAYICKVIEDNKTVIKKHTNIKDLVI